MQKTKTARTPEVIGWRELVGLPDFGIGEMRAKIDTGARTSALYAVDKKLFRRGGVRWVGFSIPLAGHAKPEPVEAPVLDERSVKNTSGVPEMRLVVRTTLLIGRHRWHIDVSLADREKMEFDLILGRTAFHGRNLLVDPNHSYLLGPPRPARVEKFSHALLRTPILSDQGEEE